ncbi:XRE family transcriptional regulator [bacterium]|nr:MAG: XRE family transcriptional regulator [bacterium]
MSRRRLESIAGPRDPMILARNVRQARESLGWTGKKLCEEAGTSPQTLANVERGKGCTPGVERRLAAALGTVVGRLWEDLAAARQILRHAEDDRWYFADAADGERYRDRQGLTEDPPPLRLDPDEIQEESERSRLGGLGLSCGFVRVTTAHLEAGVIISSVLEIYGRIESNVPEGHLAYFHALRGEVRFRIGETTHEMREGSVLQAEMTNPAWVESLRSLERGEAPPHLVYVDLRVRQGLRPSG